MNQLFKNKPLFLFLWIALFALPFLGGVHLFDWDEINFAEGAREMLETGDYLRMSINYLPFWEKPPVFIWLQAASMAVFGVGEYAARFPNAIAGIVTILCLYSFGKKIGNERLGWWIALAYGGSILPAFYFKSGIIDPWFNLFIFLGIAYFYFASMAYKAQKQGLKEAALGGLFLGLAVLTKGPAALLIAGLTVFFFWIIVWRFKVYLSWFQVIIYLLSICIATLSWFGIEMAQNGTWFIETFITYQIRLLSTPDAGHGGFPGYHFVILLIGCFPSSLIFISGYRSTGLQADTGKQFDILMKVLFWVVLILFSLVKTKIVHYSSMCYFPIAWVAGTAIYQWEQNGKPIPKSLKRFIWILGSILAIPVLIFPLVWANRDLIIPTIKDPFAVANMEAELHFTGIEFTVGIFLIGVIALFAFYAKQNKLGNAFQSLFFGVSAFMFIGLIAYIGRVEQISQNAGIEFLKSVKGKDCYVVTHGYKSYAHYFYPELKSSQKPLTDNLDDWKDYALNHKLSKDLYIITKINKTEGLTQYTQLKEIGRKNGFVFYVKPANQ